VLFKELMPLLADPVERVRQIVLLTVVGEFNFLDDTSLDEALEMLADRGLTPARVNVVQLLQRR